MRELLLANLEAAYAKHGWHGTTLRNAIRGLTADDVAWRPAKSRHNIWELIAHAAYWKYVARRRLRGAKRGSFPLKGSNWIPAPERIDEALALAGTLLVPQPSIQPAEGGLVFIAFPKLTEEEEWAVFRSGLVQMSAKVGVIEG